MILYRLIAGGLVSLLLLTNLYAETLNVAAFGDSITRGWPYHQNDANGIANNGGYVPSLQSQLNNAWDYVPGVTVFNWGHPGETIFLEPSGRARISEVLDSNPDYVLVMEGTNDLPFGVGPGAVYDKLAATVNDVSASGAIPVIGTLLPRFDKNSNQNGNIQLINTALRNLAIQNEYALADLYNASSNWNANMTDGLHPNTTGYGIMADEWFAALQNIPPFGVKPIANAGEDQVTFTNPVTLDGSASYDSDGYIQSYTWSWSSGNALGMTPAVNLPFGSNLVTLTVTDNSGMSDTDTATVTVAPDMSPGLVVLKNILNDNGGNAIVDDFHLTISATSTPLIFNDETPNSTDGYLTTYTSNAITVATSTSFSLSEIDLSGYGEGNWNCSNDGGMGSGPYHSGNVNVGASEKVVCAITNDDYAPELTLIKHVVNDNVGAATSTDFVLRLSGGTLPDSTYDGSEELTSGDKLKVESNAVYTLSEDQLPAYKLIDTVCKDDGNGADVGHPVTLAEGQNVTCTISNDDTNFLQILKDVTNNNGGTATSTSFNLFVTGGVYNGNVARKSGDILEAATSTPYTLGEEPYPGYTQTGIACKDSETGNTIPHPVVLAEKQSAICTISNDDDPSFLTLLKQVINNDGGDATADQFVLRISGGKYDGSVPRQSGEVLVADSNTTYTLTEDLFSGYRLDSIACVDDVTTFSLPHPIILDEGQAATCTLQNDDIAPVFTVEKRVVNKHGGEATPLDFTLRITGGDYDGSLDWYSGDMIPVDSNTVYTISEDQLSGYSQEGIECKDVDTDTVIPHPIKLNEGQVAICTISNIDYVSTFYVVPLPEGGASVFDL